MRTVEEKSCGAVLYRREGGAVRYLIVRSHSGHISFPKGHMDGDESEKQTARREIADETGVQVRDFEADFREIFYCTTDEGKYKEIVYLLAKLPDGPVSPADGELTDCWLLSAEEALERISTTREREILQKAAERLGVCR